MKALTFITAFLLFIGAAKASAAVPGRFVGSGTVDIYASPPSPCPLRQLCQESDLIAVAQDGQTTTLIELGREGVRAEVSLDISTVLKGITMTKTVAVYYHSEKDLASAYYPAGKTILTFLRYDQKSGMYNPVVLPDGAKLLTPEALRIYAARIKELLALDSERDKLGPAKYTEQVTEWLVKCVENPVTRWDGAYDLRQPDNGTDWLKYLSLAQKQRLSDAMFSAPEISLGELSLMKLVANWDSRKLLESLVSYLKSALDNIPKDGSPADSSLYIKDIMAITAQQINYKDWPVRTDALAQETIKKLISLAEEKLQAANDAQNQGPVAISFCTKVNADNSPISPQTAFKAGDLRIYACFPNKGSLTNLSKVTTVWTNLDTEDAAYNGTLVLNPSAAYNFIWVEMKDKWSVGEYEVKIFSATTSAIIAQGKFSVIP